jgi:hypothetical protein
MRSQTAAAARQRALSLRVRRRTKAVYKQKRRGMAIGLIVIATLIVFAAPHGETEIRCAA